MVTKQIWCFWCCGCPTQFQVLDPLSVFSLDFFVFGRLFYSSVVMAPSMMMSLYLQLQLSQPLTAKQLQCLQSGELRAGPPLHQRLQVSLFTLPHSIWREMKHARPPVVNFGWRKMVLNVTMRPWQFFVTRVHLAHVRPAAANSRPKQRDRRSSSRP